MIIEEANENFYEHFFLDDALEQLREIYEFARRIDDDLLKYLISMAILHCEQTTNAA